MENIEGEWKGFVFKRVTPEMYPSVLTHLKTNIYEDELLNRVTGNSALKIKELDQMAIQYMNVHKLSFIAIDKKTQKIAGVRMIQEIFAEQPLLTGGMVQSTELKKIIPLVTALQVESTVFDKLQIQSIASFVSLSVDREFRRLGLGTEMYRRSIVLLKAAGYSAIQGCFSCVHACKIAEDLGFREFNRKYLIDQIDENGAKIFQNSTPEDFVSLMVLY